MVHRSLEPLLPLGVRLTLAQGADQTDIPRIATGLAGKLPVSCRGSGKPNSLARDEKTGWGDPMLGRSSKTASLDLVRGPAHLSLGFRPNARHSTAYAVDTTGGGRSSAISRRMSANRFRGMATSAI